MKRFGAGTENIVKWFNNWKLLKRYMGVTLSVILEKIRANIEQATEIKESEYLTYPCFL